MAAEPDLRVKQEGTLKMVRNRILALIAFGCLLAFLGVMIYRVPRLDLALALVVTLALVAFDLWQQIGPRRG